MSRIIIVLACSIGLLHASRVKTELNEETDHVQEAVVQGIRCCKKVGSEWKRRHTSMWKGCKEDECTIMTQNTCSQIKDESKCSSSGSMLQETEREESDEVQEAVVQGIRCCKKVGSEWKRRHTSMWKGCKEDECTIMTQNTCSQIKDESKCSSSGSMLQETEREETDHVQEAVVQGIRCCKKVGSEWKRRHTSMWKGCNEDECTIMTQNTCSQIKDESKCSSSGSMLQETAREESDEVQEAVVQGIRCCKKVGSEWKRRHTSMWKGCNEDECTIMTQNTCSQIKDESKCFSSGSDES